MFAGSSIWWPLGAFVGGWFVISLVVNAFRVQRRSNDVAAIARELGFTFVPWTNDQKVVTGIETALFQTVPGLSFRNLMTGTYAGLDVRLFEYSPGSRSPGSSTPTTQTVAVYTSNTDLPWFTLEPKNFATAIVDALLHQRVDLDYPPGISPHCVVRGRDPERVKALFNGALLTFVEGLDRGRRWEIEGAGRTLVVYRGAHRVPVAELRQFLQETAAIAESFLSLSAVRATGSGGSPPHGSSAGTTMPSRLVNTRR